MTFAFQRSIADAILSALPSTFASLLFRVAFERWPTKTRGALRFPFRVCEIVAEKKYRPWRDKAWRGCIIDVWFLSLSRHRIIVCLIFSGVENIRGGDKKYRHIRFNSYLSIAKYTKLFIFSNRRIIRIDRLGGQASVYRDAYRDGEYAIPREAANFCEIKRRPGPFVHISSNCPRKSHKQTELPRWRDTPVVINGSLLRKFPSSLPSWYSKRAMSERTNSKNT